VAGNFRGIKSDCGRCSGRGYGAGQPAWRIRERVLVLSPRSQTKSPLLLRFTPSLPPVALLSPCKAALCNLVLRWGSSFGVVLASNILIPNNCRCWSAGIGFLSCRKSSFPVRSSLILAVISCLAFYRYGRHETETELRGWLSAKCLLPFVLGLSQFSLSLGVIIV